MIYEVRTYQLKPGSLSTFVQRYAEAYEDRKQYSPIVASLTCEIGPLEQMVTVWPYESQAHREQVRANSAGKGKWPPRGPDILDEMASEIFIPMDFCSGFPSGTLGPIFEWRTYRIRTDSMPDIHEVWSEVIDERRKVSPLVVAMHSENNVLNRFVHIWAYESFAHRSEARAEAVRKGCWPPRSVPPGTILSQNSKIMVPTMFSPLQ
jgi:hypothetical protein